MLVTRPQLPLTGPISRADLQELNDITVALEQSDLDEVVAEMQEQLPTGTAGINYLLNPALDTWTRGTSAASLAVGIRTLRADDWWARLNATTSLFPTYARTSNSQQQNFLYGAVLTGNTGAGSVDFGQEIAARVSATLQPNITFTFGIENGTGAALTPTVKLDTCNSLEDYGTVTARYSQATASSVASGAFTVFNVTINTSAYLAAMRNGCLLYLQFAAGTLDSAAKTIKIFPMKLELGTVATTNVVERDPPAGDSETVNDRQFLSNGDFHPERWGTTAEVTCLEDADNYAAEGWWANPSDGSTLKYQRDLNSPDSLTAYCAKLTGSPATTGTVDFGQNISSAIARTMRRQCVFSCYIYNATGAAISPQILINTPAVADDFTGTTNRDTQTLDSCADGAWTRVSYAFNAADYTNSSNGLRIFVRIPSGTMITAGDIVRIAQAKIELGANVTDFDPLPTPRPQLAGIAAAINLVVTNTSAALVNVTADEIALRAADGTVRVERAVSVTGINIAAAGAGGLDTGAEAASTWYAIWIISNGLTVSGLFSTSTTAPVLPAGYRWRALVGYVRNTAASNFINFWQAGNKVVITPTVLFTTDAPSATDTYELVSTTAGSAIVATVVPPAARFITVQHGFTTTATGATAAASDATGLGEQHHVIDATGTLGFSSFYKAAPLRIALKTQQDFYWKSDDLAAKNRMECVGYEL